MFKVKFKKLSDESLEYFAKTIYSDIQKFYNKKTEKNPNCNDKIAGEDDSENERCNVCEIFM